jgi:hypothetical protein
LLSFVVASGKSFESVRVQDVECPIIVDAVIDVPSVNLSNKSVPENTPVVAIYIFFNY